VLTACTATGAGAEPAAALEPGSAESLAAEAEGQLERFRGWLPTAKVGRGKQAALEIAELFAVSFLASYQGIPVRAITEAHAGRWLDSDAAVFGALRDWKNAF
jgi:hypothetical protein